MGNKLSRQRNRASRPGPSSADLKLISKKNSIHKGTATSKQSLHTSLGVGPLRFDRSIGGRVRDVVNDNRWDNALSKTSCMCDAVTKSEPKSAAMARDAIVRSFLALVLGGVKTRAC